MIIGLANKKSVKILFILTAISFLWFGTFGLLHHMSEMKSDVVMGDCLINGQAEICTMNFSEHIALWQEMLMSLPQNTGLLELLILAIALVAITIFWKNPISEFSKSVASRWRLYIKQHPHINLFISLREAFSQGILNPKNYQSATI